MRVELGDGNANLSRVLEEAPRRAELADVVPAAAVGSAEGEGVVGGAVTDDGARLGVRHEHRRRGVPLLVLGPELDETGALGAEAVVDGKCAAEADGLRDVEDVARADGGAVHEVGGIAGETALEEHEPVGAVAAVRSGRPVRGELALRALLGTRADDGAGLVPRGDLLDDHGGGRL